MVRGYALDRTSLVQVDFTFRGKQGHDRNYMQIIEACARGHKLVADRQQLLLLPGLRLFAAE